MGVLKNTPFQAKKAFDININDKVIMIKIDVLVNRRYRVFLISVRAEPVTVVMELCFAYRFKNL